MQFTLGDKGEVYLLGESVLTVTEKERRGEAKSSIGPRIKYVLLILTSFQVLAAPESWPNYLLS